MRSGPAPGRGGRAGAGPLFVLFAGLALPGSLYAWMAASPEPVSIAKARTAGLDPLAGLPAALGIGVAAALALLGVMSAWEPARAWRGRVATAAGGLYLAGALSAAGKAALVLAPAAALLILAVLAVKKRDPVPDGLFLAIHAGVCGTAACFFNQWPLYARAWEPFLSNLAALGTLLF